MQAVRLACILYTAEIRRMFGIMGVFSDLHTVKLRACIEKTGSDWGELGVLRMWCLAMGGMESRGAERGWFLGELERERERKGSWEDVEGGLRGVLWFEDVHGVMFGEVWRGDKGPPGVVDDPLGGSRFGGYRPL